jgi:broad specificity phosphatase PhoE
VRLLLIRHGQSRANVEGILQGATPGELTAHGHRQAEAVAGRLASVAPDLILSSDLRRARDTAEAIAVATGRSVEEDGLLREWDVGAFEGRRPEELVAAAARAGLPLEAFAPPGGERLLDVAVRAGTVAERLVARRGEGVGTLVVVSHGDLLRALIGRLLGGGHDVGRRFHLENSSVTEFRLVANDWRVERVNDTAHLAGPAGVDVTT